MTFVDSFDPEWQRARCRGLSAALFFASDGERGERTVAQEGINDSA